MEIISAVFPVFIVILCGYIFRKCGLLNEAFVDTSNTLIYYILLPALLFSKIGTSKFGVAFNPRLIFGSYGATVFIFFLSSLFGKALKLSPPLMGTFVQGSFRANLAYVGLSIVYNYSGDLALRKAAVLLGFMVPLLTFLAIIALVLPHKTKNKKEQVKMLKEVITNPLIVASFLGIIWCYFALTLPLILSRSLDILSSTTLPLALLSLGASFEFTSGKSSVLLAFEATIMKNLFLPFAALLIFHFTGLRGIDMMTGVIMMGAPTAVITYVFAYQLKGDPALASTIVVGSTLMSVLTITFWIFFVHWMNWI